MVDQIKTKEDAAAPDADSVIKAIAPLCKAELTKVIERRAAALAQDMLAARVRVEAHARRIDPWDDFAPFSVTDGSDPRDKQWDRFRLKEPVRSAALGEITETSEVHQKKLEEALSAAWTGYVVPGIVIPEVARAAAVELDFQKLTLFSNVLAAMPVGKPPSNENQDRLLAIFNDLDNASNEADKNALARTRNALASTRIDGPLPKAVHDQLLEDFPTLPSLAKALATMPLGQPLPERIHDQLLADQRQAIEKQDLSGYFEYRLPRLSIMGLWYGATKVQGWIMQLLGPLAIVLVIVGYSVNAILRKYLKQEAEADGDPLKVVLGLLGFLIVFSLVTIIYQRRNERLIQVADMRKRMLDLFDKVSPQLQRSFVDAAKAGAERALGDYLRHIREYIEAAIAHRHARHRGQVRTLGDKKKLLEATGAKFDSTLEVLEKAAKTIKADQVQLKKLAEKHILGPVSGDGR